MYTGWTLLGGPGHSAVGRGNDATISTHCPPMHGTVRGEGYRVEMILRRRADFDPSLSGVFRQGHRAACADHNRAPGILHKESIEAGYDPRVLVLPLKAAVAGVQNYPVGADRPSVTLVVGKTNSANGVALRAWVLPFPSAVACLREY